MNTLQSFHRVFEKKELGGAIAWHVRDFVQLGGSRKLRPGIRGFFKRSVLDLRRKEPFPPQSADRPPWSRAPAGSG